MRHQNPAGNRRVAFLRRTVTGMFVLLLAASPAAAELPNGWQVEVFSGAIHDMIVDGTVIVAATGGGLLLYDTQTDAFAQIADAGCADGDCLRSNQLTSVARDARGQYWVGTLQSGLSVVRPPFGTGAYGHFFADNLRFGGALLADSVLAVAVWRDETVYAATTRGVAQIDLQGSIENYNAQASRPLGANGFPDARIHDIHADSMFVWVASDAGMVRYSRNPPFTVYQMTAGFEGTVAYCIKSLNGVVYAGTDVGLLRWSELTSSWTRIPAAPPNDFEVFDIAGIGLSGATPRYVVGSRGEVWNYNGFAWGRLSPPALPLLQSRRFDAVVSLGDTVYTCQVNDQDEGAFLEVLDTSKASWSRRQKSSIPPSAINRVDVNESTGDIWVGTQFGGVARLAPAGSWCVYNGNDPDVAANMSDDQGRIEAMLVDAAGDLWFTPLVIDATWPVDRLRGDGNCVHAQDVWGHIPPDSLGFGGRYWEMEEDGLGNRYFLSDGESPGPGGIDVVSADLSQWANLRVDLLGGDAIGALAFDRPGNWLFAYVGVNNRGTQGLVRWANSNDIFDPTSNNFQLSQLPKAITEYRDIVVDRRGGREQLWLATNEELLQYDLLTQDTLRTVGLKLSGKPGLLSPDIRDLELDDFGSLWIATTKGVNRIQLDQFAASGLLQVDAYSTRETIAELNASNPIIGRLYDPFDTVKPLPSSSVISVAFDSGTHELLIGTELGLARFDVTRIGVRPTTPVDKAFAFPNPLRVLDGDEVMYIGGINEVATVKVYNLEGELVFERINVEPVRPGESPDASNEAWDLKTLGSTAAGYFAAAAGVYLVRIETSQGSKITNLTVIR